MNPFPHGQQFKSAIRTLLMVLSSVNVVSFCSCRAIDPNCCPPNSGGRFQQHLPMDGQSGYAHNPYQQQGAPPALPWQAFTEAEPNTGQWRPANLTGAWPREEYIRDGGDRDLGVVVRNNWDVLGLDQEDTIGHYDTVDGQTQVDVSNRVNIYAPRFAAVRKTYGLGAYRSRQLLAGTESPTQVAMGGDVSVASTVLQPIQPGRNIGLKSAFAFRDRTGGTTAKAVQILARLDVDELLPYEDFMVVRRGIYDTSEKVRLANQMSAALAWTNKQAASVMIDEQMAVEAAGQEAAQESLVYELPDGKSKLRILKLASTDNALPGETVDFTIRFDNMGNQEIGNVTIIDNLTYRLAYEEDSAKCSVDADFITVANEGESLILRWEINKPLKVGEGGVIRFRCKVR